MVVRIIGDPRAADDPVRRGLGERVIRFLAPDSQRDEGDEDDGAPGHNPETADAAAKINMTTPAPSTPLQGSRLTMAPDSKAINVDGLLTINPVQRSAPFTPSQYRSQIIC